MIQLQIKGESYLCLCPVCGDCWARLQGDSQDFFWHSHLPCERHSTGRYHFNGCLLEIQETNLDLLDQLPPDLITREFRLHMEHL